MAEPEAKPKRTFGGLTPQEAGRKGAAAKKLRDLASAEAAQAASDGRIVFVRTPVHLGDIIAKLSAQATKGDVSSARELRSYMAEFPVDDDTDVAALDRRTRQRLKARLLADLALTAPMPHSPDAPMTIGPGHMDVVHEADGQDG